MNRDENCYTKQVAKIEISCSPKELTANPIKCESYFIMFSKLSIENWRQFSKVEIEFHPKITIITGANGAGKSTILNILSQHFGWNSSLLATPMISKDGTTHYFSGLFKYLQRKNREVTETREISKNEIGFLEYHDGKRAPLTVPADSGITYNVSIDGMQSVLGLHINSHRPVPNYQRVANIPTNAISAEQAYQIFHNETISRYQNQHTQYSSTYRMKEAIISMATFGPGNIYVQPNPAVAELFSEFKNVLSKILPPSIGFLDISVRIPDVVIVTETGDFVIDSASGGLMSLIDLAWQIFLYAHDKDQFVIIFDEPENHLHPSMQRSLVQRLLNAFPKVQFVIATHSPFIVSSVRDSSVYVLKYDGIPDTDAREVSEITLKRQISSLKLDNLSKAGTASEILREVLGVPVTLPEWAELELNKIVEEFSIDEISTEKISELKGKLESAGLGEYYSDAVQRMVQGR